ncbi:MAG: DUF222 domain-containing protein [Micrococcaceae bacterium]
MTTKTTDPSMSGVSSFVAELDRLSLGEALTVLHGGLERIVERTSTPEAVSEFARYRVPAATKSAEAHAVSNAEEGAVHGERHCTLPALLETTQRMAAVVAGVQSRLDGFTADAFHSLRDRSELLGLPAKGKIGYRDPREFLQDATRISRFEATRRTRQAEDFRPHVSGTKATDDASGQQDEATAGRLGALLPAVSARFAAAQIDTGRLALLRSAVERVEKQARVAGAGRDVVERLLRDADEQLARAASEDTYDEFRAAVKHWSLLTVRAVSEDPITSAERQAEEQRALVYVGQRGALHDWMISTPQDGHEALCALQSAATNPRRPQSVIGPDEPEHAEAAGAAQGDADGATDGDDVEAESPADGRSREQRVHDAFFGVLRAGWSASDQGGSSSGGPQLIVTAGITTLLGLAHRDGLLDEEFDPQLLANGTTEDLMVSAGFSGSGGAGVLRRMLCTAEVTPVVLGTKSEVLDVGRKHRLFTPAQRRALVARDGGCAAPGCTFPAAWCEAHHVTEWVKGGATSVDNGVLLCSHHHHAVHEGMWEIEMVDHVPWFTATARLNSLERDRQPRRNTYWKPGRATQPRSPDSDAEPGASSDPAASAGAPSPPAA